MKNKDLLNQENKELMQNLSEALKNDDEEAMAEPFLGSPMACRNVSWRNTVI